MLNVRKLAGRGGLYALVASSPSSGVPVLLDGDRHVQDGPRPLQPVEQPLPFNEPPRWTT